MRRVVGSKSGFSLIEVMVSLALFCVFIGLVAANVRFVDQYILRSQVDMLFSTFRYLQKCAVVDGQDKTLIFDLTKNQYEYQGRICKFPRQVIFGFADGVKGPPLSPSKIITSPTTFQGNRAVFYKDGIIDAGTVYITDTNKKFFYAISNGVAQVSYPRKYLYNGKWALIK